MVVGRCARLSWWGSCGYAWVVFGPGFENGTEERGATGLEDRIGPELWVVRVVLAMMVCDKGQTMFRCRSVGVDGDVW